MPIELVPAGTQFDFIGKRKIAASFSVALLIASGAAIAINGVKLGIDFQGGTEMQVLFAPGASVDESAIRAVIGECGITDSSVVRYGETEADEFLIRFQLDATAAGSGEGCRLTAEQLAALERAAQAGGGGGDAGEKGETIDKLTYALGNTIGALTVQRVEFVGPRVGAELRDSAIRSLGVACVLILLYIAFRFSVRFAPGAIIALIHDIGITSGIFVILGLEFDLRVLAALLAIIGYSLNDTIIIYDRIRENMAIRTTHDLADVLNQSVNQTLARTILTSGTTLIAVGSLWVLGGEVIRPFAIAMAIGIVVGTYSSIFIASPTLLLLETRFGTPQAPSSPAASPSSDAAFSVRRDSPPPSKSIGPKGSKSSSRKNRRPGKRKKGG